MLLLLRFMNYYLGVLLFMASLLMVVSGINFYLSSTIIFLEWGIFEYLSSSVVMLILLDWMSLLFSGFVLLISSMVMMYSFYYMEGDKYIVRFTLLVYLFVTSMLLMILSPNLVSILLGWDGLGLVSYCLVIYYQGVSAGGAGMLTVLSNRVGDVALLLSIAWVLNWGSWNIFYIQNLIVSNYLFLILGLVILASMTKSAQIPFSAWLPAAMAAPTPVSALVHSSTLVTAGVYLMIRFHGLFETNMFLFYSGVLTMFMSGVGANLEMDLKKIIALSTLSQLGVMMFILSLGYWELSFFHLLSHALFKSLLFLCAGGFIHYYSDAQDVRYLGGVSLGFPLMTLYFSGCSFSLCGFPFLSGFYSKDLILELYFMGYLNMFIFFLVTVGTLMTMTYSLRLGFYLFLKNLGVKMNNFLGEGLGLVVPMTLLFIVSIWAGSGLSWLFFPSLMVFLPRALSIFFLISMFMLLFFFCWSFTGSAIFLNKFNWSLLFWKYYLGGMWFMPWLSTGGFMFFLSWGYFFLKYFDQTWVEYLGGQGAYFKVSESGLNLDYSFFFDMKIYFYSFFLFFLAVFYLV